MITEIGSEFWTEDSNNSSLCGIKELLPRGGVSLFTLSGRTALDIIIEDLIWENRIQSVFLPSYCCYTMIEPFVKHGIKVKFYDVIARNGRIEQLLLDNDCDVVFLLEYFGYLDKEVVKFAEKEKYKGKTIIYDATQSIFCELNKEKIFDYVFCSLKKWTDVNAGFVVKMKEWTYRPQLVQNFTFVNLRNKAFDLKKRFIENDRDVDKNIFLSLFKEAEDMLDKDYRNYAIDKHSELKLNSLRIEKLREKRKKNAQLLIDGIRTIPQVKLLCDDVRDDECPLFVPISVPSKRDELRRYLIERKIYLPVHWPISKLHQLNSDNRLLFNEELSCVCDQRYSDIEMKRIVDEIRSFFK